MSVELFAWVIGEGEVVRVYWIGTTSTVRAYRSEALAAAKAWGVGGGGEAGSVGEGGDA